MAEEAPPPLASASDRPAASRALPPTILLPNPCSGNRRAPVRSSAQAAGSSGRGRRKGKAPADSAAGAGGEDRLAAAVRLVGREVDAGFAGADILELAMAKGPMFSWLAYWPEEGYPKEDHPY